MNRVKLKEMMLDDEEHLCLMRIEVNGKDIIVQHSWYEFFSDQIGYVDFEKYWEFLRKDVSCNLYLVGRYIDDEKSNLEKLGPIYIETDLNDFGVINGLKVQVVEKIDKNKSIVFLKELGVDVVARLYKDDGFHCEKECLEEYDIGEIVMISEATLFIDDITPIIEKKETEME